VVSDDHDSVPAAAPAGPETTAARRIAFGGFADWEPTVRYNLDARYSPVFVDLAEARLDDFDAVVPRPFEHYRFLAQRPDLRGRKFFHPSPHAVALCGDKLGLIRFLKAEGLDDCVPPLRSPGAPYPYIWKRRFGAFGRECHVVDGPGAERNLDLNDDDWFAQTLTHGSVEYTAHILRTDGVVRYASTFIFEMAGEALIRGEPNAPIDKYFSRSCDHLDLFSEILSRLDYEGVACFNYKLARERPLIFEINPRFGGSLCNDVTAFLDAYVAALQPN
jgi:hypothetical protein